MQIDLVPMLRIERDLYDLPRGEVRFRRYIEIMTRGGEDLALPLTLLNPMGKEHVAAALDALIALGAEETAATAAAEASRRLERLPGELRVGLVMADDAGGGWTDRCLTDARQCFENDADPKRGWAVALFWTSEVAAADSVRSTVMAAIYRATCLELHGLPGTLRKMMAQEGRAAAFAGLRPAFTPRELASIRGIIDPIRDSASYPIAIAALYGDEAARSVGYPVLGLPSYAGFGLALSEALQEPMPPEACLQGQPVRAAASLRTPSK